MKRPTDKLEPILEPLATLYAISEFWPVSLDGVAFVAYRCAELKSDGVWNPARGRDFGIGLKIEAWRENQNSASFT